jgi:hypothetical protein
MQNLRGTPAIPKRPTTAGFNHYMHSLKAKLILPNMPEELFLQHMEPMIAEHGWPFYSRALNAFPAVTMKTISLLTLGAVRNFGKIR